MKIPIILLFFFPILFPACKDKCDDTKDFLNSRDAALNLSFVDKNTGTYLLKTANGALKKTDILITSTEMNPLNVYFNVQNIPGSTDTYYSVSFRFFEEGFPQIGDEILKRIFINLKDDRDTIDYLIKTKNGDCAPAIDRVKVWYNGKLFADASEKTDIPITISK